MDDPDPLINLLFSLLQCFGVILIGYLAVKFSVISSQAGSIGVYVSKFAMPALFFRTMTRINFEDINWLFIAGIALGKLIIFSITVICTLLITRPINFGIAGMLSMFVTQSNAVAIGYPIVQSLYPHLSKYMYLFAPIQFVIINPLCFILLEWHEYRSSSTSPDIVPKSLKLRILLVLKNVAINPLVFMTIAGVLIKVLFHKLPLVIDRVVLTLGNSFIGVSLFYLGMNMVGKVSMVTKRDAYILLLLLLGKLIFLPFLTRELVVHLIDLHGHTNMSLNYSFVAFLYGGLPTSAPVFLIANNFKILPDLIATGIVIGTLISGPLMFINARLIMMKVSSKAQLDHVLKPLGMSLSIISLFGCIWVLVIFILKKRYRTSIHKVTMGYITFIILMCFGMLFGQILHPYSSNQMYQHRHLEFCIQFSIYYMGCIGTRLWTIIVAGALMIIKRKGITCLQKNISHIFLIGFCTPAAVVATLFLCSGSETAMSIYVIFQYGKSQLITSSLVLATSIVFALIFIILEARSISIKKTSNLGKALRDVEPANIDTKEKDKILCEPSNHSQEDEYKSSISSFENDCGLINLEPDAEAEELQIERHIALVILLLITMGFGLFLCLWRLMKEEVSGLYIELEFLDCVFNFGQGFILWVIFGLDSQLVISPVKSKILSLWCVIQRLHRLLNKGPAHDVNSIRKTFSENHLENCRTDIVKNIRHTFKLYNDVFTGKSLVDWIERIGLANNRSDAIGYGQALFICSVIEHVQNGKCFMDDEESLYRFTESFSNSQPK